MNLTSRLFQFLIFVVSLNLVSQNDLDFETKFTVEHLRDAPVKLMPFPQEYTWQEGVLNVSEVAMELNALGNENTSALLSELTAILSKNNIKVVDKSSIVIKFKQNKKIKDEGYALEVNKMGIIITSSSESGSYYALQTLRQLIENSQVPFITISDWPKHSLRGYMIDVGRNYQSMESLKNQVDIMAEYKLNTFHWHLTDKPA